MARVNKSDTDHASDIPEIFRDAIDSLTEGFALFDRDHRLVMCNKANRDMSHPLEHLIEPGVTREHLIRETAKHGGYRAPAEGEQAWISKQMATSTEFTQDIEMEKLDGTCHLVSTYPTNLGGLVVTCRDVTEKKRAEAEKRQSDDLIRTVLETSPAAIVMARLDDGKIIYSSPAAKDLFGDNKSAIDNYADPSDRETYLAALLENGKVDDFLGNFVRRNGDNFTASVSGRLVTYMGEQVVVSTMTDLTQQLEADALVRTVLDASLAIVTMVRVSDGRILYRSPGATDLLGVKEFAKDHYAVPDKRAEYIARLRAGKRVDNYNVEVIDAEGKKVPVSMSSRIIEYKGEEVIVTSIVDLTDQVEADMLMRTVLDASSAIISMVGIDDGEILYRTPAALALFGDSEYAKDNYVRPVERDEFVRQLKSKHMVEDFKVEFKDAEGKKFPASITSRIIEYKDEQVMVTSLVDLTKQNEADAMIRRVMEACPVPVQMTRVEDGELLFRSSETIALFGEAENSKLYYADPRAREKYLAELRKKGWVNNHKVELINADDERFWGAVSARLIDFKGEEVIVSNTRDLTEDNAIQEELKTQRELLFQNEKMSALGELLAGVAHELNNPLSIVVGHSLMLHEEANDPDTVRRIEKISNAAERCAKIVKTFLAMARQQPTKMEPTDINSIVSTAVDVAGYGRGNEELTIKCNLDGKIPDIVADGDQITQVIINLIINAEQAIVKSRAGNQIKVATKLSKNSDNIKITVKDNGPGIPDNIRARIFEPFFTTKDVGDGTGIGLAFCHRIIHSHDGQIWLDPHHKKGSKFIIELPIVNAKTDHNQSIDDASRTAVKAKALIVDDEVDVADLISEILVKEGFKVEIANSGSEAVKKLEKGKFDLLLSDLNMPEVDGRGLYEILKKDFPDTLEVTAFITGDTMGATSQALLQESKRPYLEKPVSPADLRKLVYGILEGKKASA